MGVDCDALRQAESDSRHLGALVHPRHGGDGDARSPPVIHDFGGFPPALHAFEYPAPGDPGARAPRADLLAPISVRMDDDWGLDHGTWSVLTHVYPEADVPVVQLASTARSRRISTTRSDSGSPRCATKASCCSAAATSCTTFA